MFDFCEYLPWKHGAILLVAMRQLGGALCSGRKPACQQAGSSEPGVACTHNILYLYLQPFFPEYNIKRIGWDAADRLGMHLTSRSFVCASTYLPVYVYVYRYRLGFVLMCFVLSVCVPACFFMYVSVWDYVYVCICMSCMYVCMYVCMYACMHVCIYDIYFCRSVCKCMYVYEDVCMYMYACIHTFIGLYVYMYVFMHACMYVCIPIYLFRYIHVYIYT